MTGCHYVMVAQAVSVEVHTWPSEWYLGMSKGAYCCCDGSCDVLVGLTTNYVIIIYARRNIQKVHRYNIHQMSRPLIVLPVV